jgi:hypothetical protein
MYKRLSADKDTYLTNKYVNAVTSVSSNLGIAGTLDLFKLYGYTLLNNVKLTELSRLLLHFDLTELRQDVSSGKIDVGDQSFFCKLSLKDVYGGQTTPSDFTVEVFPLSASFDEGLGKDVSKYSDKDLANWLTASFGSAWHVTGCARGGGATQLCDYITSSVSIPSTGVTQYFKTGEEDLLVDVTKIVSATISGELPDAGFRLSLSSSLETDLKTYFVKRFGSRHAYDDTKHPRLIYGCDDSITDDTLNLAFDTTCSINLYSFPQGVPSNIKSGSNTIAGNDCLLLKLVTNQPSGTTGDYTLFFTGSQYSRGINYSTGTYYANVIVDTNDTVKNKLKESGSIKFTTQWLSLDTTVTYSHGETLTFFEPTRSSYTQTSKVYRMSVTNVQDEYSSTDVPVLRVNVFDESNPLIKVTKVPIEAANTVFKTAYYSVRDAVTNEVVIPKDDVNNSTKLSSDSKGMFFKLYLSSLPVNRTYAVDVHTTVHGNSKTYQNASQVFKVVK